MKKIYIAFVAVIFILCVIIVIPDNFFDQISSPQKTLIGVLMLGNRQESAWNRSHFNALESLKGQMNLDITYAGNILTNEACLDSIASFMQQGIRLVFSTNISFENCVDNAERTFPEMRFFQVSGTKTSAHKSIYFGRMYQMRYLAGIAAGRMTKTNNIGYVASFPINEVNRGINAFALGARSINPKAKVFVAWTSSWNDYKREESAAFSLISKKKVDVITSHEDNLATLDVAESNNIFCIGYNEPSLDKYPKSGLFSIYFDWTSFYRKAIAEFQQDRFISASYWYGIDSDVIKMSEPMKKISPLALGMIAQKRMAFLNGTWDVFYGPIKDNSGTLRVQKGESLSDAQLSVEMDWFVEGVERK